MHDLHSLQQMPLLSMRSERSIFIILVLNVVSVGDVLSSLLSHVQIYGPCMLRCKLTGNGLLVRVKDYNH